MHHTVKEPTVLVGVTPTPANLSGPEDVIEATFALADQGLRIGRRLALTVTSGVRSLTLAA